MRKILLTLLTTTISILSMAQNMTNAPTSMFGIGELATGDGGQFSGMGGVSIALRADNFINSSNPAGLTALPARRYVVDAGVMLSYDSYTELGTTNTSVTGNLNNFGIGCRIIPRWCAALSFTPVSSVGYAITQEEPVQGTNGYISSLYEGQGGLSKISINNGILITPRLSVGVNFSYVSGTIKYTETQGTATEQYSSFKYAVYSDFGLQYHLPIGTDRSLVVGAVYGYSQKLVQDNDLYVYSSSSGEEVDRTWKKVKQYMPQYTGAGVAYNSLRTIVSAEYKYVNWSRMGSDRSSIKFRDQHLIKAGMSYAVGNIYKNPVRVMGGIGYQNSYMVISGNNADNYHISAGLGFTIRNTNTLSVGVKYRDQFHVPYNRPHERGFSAYLNISFSERSYRGKLQ
ncbi:MAG: hypothetical protein LUF04_15245 [Bacteroides sp.]|nr:hypothetical protein [Bacteroides sp.]